MTNGQWAGSERCRVLKAIKKDVKEIQTVRSEDKNTVVSSIDWLLNLYRCGK